MSFLGAKSASGAYQAIIAAMPAHDVYIETHLGTGAVMRFKPPAVRSIGLELDPAVLAAFEPPDFPVELYECDCIDFLELFDFIGAGRVLIYADPPYLLTTRSTRRYRRDYTQQDHERLLDVLKRVPAAVILSGYPSTFYDDVLEGWRTLEFQAMTRGGVRTEKLWMNFEAGSVHWSTFAGRDFTDRQRIKRKASRWAAKYRELPGAERLAVLAALLNVHAAAAIDAPDHGGLQLAGARIDGSVYVDDDHEDLIVEDGYAAAQSQPSMLPAAQSGPSMSTTTAAAPGPAALCARPSPEVETPRTAASTSPAAS